ncbi:MAG TPA: NADH-quinone oxidoreductase subunit N [Candidatus Kryptonia bacterium]|nr:NADH-quinone oxidoreductase subunit N [Candidatus Kryptonia bacterium]
MSFDNIQSLPYLVPELLLTVTLIAIFIGDLAIANKQRLGEIALVGTAMALVALSRLSSWPDGWLFNRMIVHDQFAVFFKLIFALATVATVLMSLSSNEVQRSSQGEYYGILLSSTLAMFFMASASNLLMAYLSLEFVSLTSYTLTGILKHNRRSGEAALKYLIYGGVASGAMIYGMSWIFGLTGSMDYARIGEALSQGGANQLALFIALVLTFAGFGYKIAAVPFHMWAPDVYQGAPIPVTAFLSVGSKAAGFALLIRFFYPALSRLTASGEWTAAPGVEWPQLVLVLSMLTMTLGNFAALSQQNLKRLLAYSSIAHAGYVLMGFVVLSNDGLRAMMFYLLVYYLMNIGAFLVVMIVANSTGREDLDGYRGLAWRGGAAPAVAMAIFLFSLAGLPPLAGFIGKFYLFAAVIEGHFYWLALVGVLNSVVSLYYYARIVKAMFLDQPAGNEGDVAVGLQDGCVLWTLAAATLGLGLYWSPAMGLVERSLHFFIG